MIDYKVISTGSKGNAVIINGTILIDCGVSFKALKPYVKDLKIVLLTHIHGDHFNKATIKRLASERPMLRFACCEWLVKPLVYCDVSKSKIDVLQCNKKYDYGTFTASPIKLVHNVENCGYKLFFGTEKLIYATDTNSLDGVEAKDYDLYMIEANYEDEEIQERIKAKADKGEFAYEHDVLLNHLSKAKADNFIYSNIGKGEYVYLHGHEG